MKNKKSVASGEKYKITVTRLQLEIIKHACEEWFRVRYGQFMDFADDIARFGYYYDKSDPENERKFNEYIQRKNELHDMLNSYYWKNAALLGARTAPNDCRVASDIWAVLDGRRVGTGFVLGSEPQVIVEEVPDGQEQS